MATLEDTWEYQTDIQIKFEATNSAAFDKVWHMIGLKRALTGESTSFTTLWTVVGSGGQGSGGGGGMDATDRWLNLRGNADATGNWLCLRGPTGTALEDVWFCLINSSGSNQQGRFVVTDTAPTGGGETTPPTFSGKIIDTGTMTIMERWDGADRPYRATVGMSGEGAWYFFASGAIGEHSTTVWMLGRTSESSRRTGDLPGMFYIHTDDGVEAPYYLQQGNNWYAYHSDGSTVVCSPVSPGYHAGTSGLNSIFNSTVIEDKWETVDRTIPEWPLYVYSFEAGKEAFRGRIVDIYLCPGGASNNIFEPTSGPPIESITMNSFWLPATSRMVI